MRYGFTKDGGFVVVDDDLRIGEFAFASSDYERSARKNPPTVAILMLARHWSECPADIRERHYLMSCEQLTNRPVIAAPDKLFGKLLIVSSGRTVRTVSYAETPDKFCILDSGRSMSGPFSADDSRFAPCLGRVTE